MSLPFCQRFYEILILLPITYMYDFLFILEIIDIFRVAENFISQIKISMYIILIRIPKKSILNATLISTFLWGAHSVPPTYFILLLFRLTNTIFSISNVFNVRGNNSNPHYHDNLRTQFDFSNYCKQLFYQLSI